MLSGFYSVIENKVLAYRGRSMHVCMHSTLHTRKQRSTSKQTFFSIVKTKLGSQINRIIKFKLKSQYPSVSSENSNKWLVI